MGMTNGKTIKIIDKTLEDFYNCEGGESWLRIDGEEYSTDVGYALEGMEIYAKVLKNRLTESEDKNDKIDCKHTVRNNCVNHKYCDYEPTTKNDLGVDAVSRKAVINQIFYSTDNNGDVVLGSALRERIARLPSVTPIRPKGHWICDRANVRCSCCGRGYKDCYGKARIASYNYCPNCGADMREVEE